LLAGLWKVYRRWLDDELPILSAEEMLHLNAVGS